MNQKGRNAGSRIALLCVLTGTLLLGAGAQAHGQQPAGSATQTFALEANPQLFATMCALYAAGYAQDVDMGASPIRQ